MLVLVSVFTKTLYSMAVGSDFVNYTLKFNLGKPPAANNITALQILDSNILPGECRHDFSG